MLASVELKKRENRDDLDFLQMNGYGQVFSLVSEAKCLTFFTLSLTLLASLSATFPGL
jgi:hypothetical protein